MAKEIIINASAGETRVALLDRGVFQELHLERESGRSVGGMVVRGRVTRVLPGMQAAFVDIGLDKAAFLYVSDVAGGSRGPADDIRSMACRSPRTSTSSAAVRSWSWARGA